MATIQMCEQVGPVWQCAEPNETGIRPLTLVPVNPKNSNRPLPRYVQARQLKSGLTSYYWCPPTWARKNDFAIKAQALGPHLDKARNRINILNSHLDNWRKNKTNAHKFECPFGQTAKMNLPNDFEKKRAC